MLNDKVNLLPVRSNADVNNTYPYMQTSDKKPRSLAITKVHNTVQDFIYRVAQVFTSQSQIKLLIIDRNNKKSFVGQLKRSGDFPQNNTHNAVEPLVSVTY